MVKHVCRIVFQDGKKKHFWVIFPGSRDQVTGRRGVNDTCVDAYGSSRGTTRRSAVVKLCDVGDGDRGFCPVCLRTWSGNLLCLKLG